MGNDSRTGLQITPLALWVTAGLGGIIATIVISFLASISADMSTTKTNVATLVTSQQYDRREIDSLKGDVKSVQGEVRSLAERVGKLEPRK